ncbi:MULTISPECIES: ferredoxin--NADP reductase [unclassified Acinetobacter]|uniref:ferredoxin--NADP reductase n=1 Tax=unclassified Acinetobacter TaxID=196816 RepID=UPI0035BA3708
MIDEKFLATQVISIHTWSDTLFSFTVTRPDSFRFTAGQFARIGILVDGELIVRAYSVVSSPYDEYLEFFSIVVPDGAFTSRLQHLQLGDTLYIEKVPYGFLTLARYQQPAPQDLWLLATGTGVAPFISMLQDFKTWEDYQHIILVYSVRTAQELAYQDKIAEIKALFADEPAKLTFIPIVTREVVQGALNQRLPQLIASGELERVAELKFDVTRSHVMLCGNPQMVEDTKESLKAIGLTMNRRGEGNIAVENYW